MQIHLSHEEKSHDTPDKPVIAFVVNDEPNGAIGLRAQAFATRLADDFQIHILYRSAHKLRSLGRFAVELLWLRPHVTYVFDMAYSGVLAALLCKLLRHSGLVIETGDVIYELAKSMGTRGRVGLGLTKALEEVSIRAADWLVVRGTRHKEWLEQKGSYRVDVIPDGVGPEQFVAVDSSALRQQYGLDDVLTVGLVGSSIWSERWDMGYGWELVEALRLLPDASVKGVLIGDGSGVVRLKELCRRYGVEHKMLFLGRIPLHELPRFLDMLDVCISTQTNDLVGQVRTTGKLPLYLAAGRYILASKVGEAERVLDEEMLVEYEGIKDERYPERLAMRLATLATDRARLKKGAANRRLAEEQFHYDRLAVDVKNVVWRSLHSPAD